MNFDELEKVLRARDDVEFGNGAYEEVVRDAEHRLGVTFPPSLRAYLMRFGRLELGHFELFGLGDDTPEFLRLVEVTISERTETGSPLRHDLVPLLNDGGGNLYCMATAGEHVGSVVVWDHSGGVGQELEQYASTFGDWIADLLEDLEDDG